ncbi:hypothetical protein SAMN05421799_10711 [Alicyclobacillus vulcanalis]|uniref:Thioredoxin domain-containing protein n=1 Tax=Alicyclobacillus vulcanalis TaxID=252246 RepID=A0A1N7N290_9BACL|nr:hypothetical protein SAMN05421799_10711 [Alicyclobacillus vulcanalis]
MSVPIRPTQRIAALAVLSTLFVLMCSVIVNWALKRDPATRPLSVESFRSTEDTKTELNPVQSNYPNRWHGLRLADKRFLDVIFGAHVVNSENDSVRIASDKPILFSAPWCPYCALTEHLLSSEHLLQKFTIVGVDINGSDPTFGVPPHQAGNGTQAREVFQADWDYYGIAFPTSSLLFALPSNPINSVVKSYPTYVIPHDGAWYVGYGYNGSSAFWKEVLG